MIEITDSAVEKVKEILEMEDKADWGIRLLMGGGCCASYGLDLSESPTDEDEVIEKGGMKLFVDKNLSSSVQGMIIDFVDDGQQQGFVLKGGESSCGPSCCS